MWTPKDVPKASLIYPLGSVNASKEIKTVHSKTDISQSESEVDHPDSHDTKKYKHIPSPT